MALFNRRTGSEEPGLDDEAELGRGALPLQELFGVVPTHPAPGGAASHEDDFALIRSGFGFRHGGGVQCKAVLSGD